MTALVELRGIAKRFGEVQALRGVDLDLLAGEVHVLAGENGAGKTSLMNVLAGLYRPDEGSIAVDGGPVRIASPKNALALGIGMVHQHFQLVAALSALDNVLLGAEEGVLSLRRDRRRAELQTLGRRFGLEVDLDRAVGELPVGVQQKVEILRALDRKVRVLILDEPTTHLAPQEVDTLFGIVRELAAAGTSVVIITHKVAEMLAVGDRVSVMRRGQLVTTAPRTELTAERLVALLMGDSATAGEEPVAAIPRVQGGSPRGLPGQSPAAVTAGDAAAPAMLDADAGSPRAKPGQPLAAYEALGAVPVPEMPDAGRGSPRTLAGQWPAASTGADGVSVAAVPQAGRGAPGAMYSSPAASEVAGSVPVLELRGLAGCSLKVMPGEIVGVAGVAGNGQRDLAEAIMALRPASGEVWVRGRRIAARVRDRIRAGIAYVPEDRLAEGVLPRASIAESLYLGLHTVLQRGWGLPLGRLRSLARQVIDDYHVAAPGESAPSATLSGGNIQKLLVGRAVLLAESEQGAVLLAMNPTRGLDVATTRLVHGRLLELRRRGRGVLLISEDLDELVELCDRILALYRGAIAGEFLRDAYDVYQIGAAMAGAVAAHAA